MPGAPLAFDRASLRTYDRDGRLHVAACRLSKAAVNDYLGHEIPESDRLGLSPNRIYRMLRHPEELAKAAPTFRNLPLLIVHAQVSADEPRRELVVGCTSGDVRFDDPYLVGGLTIWDAEAIAGVESGEQRELSCGYRYTPDMTPGTFEGERYDGVMRRIIGNHVALVAEGRAGSDVLVADHRHVDAMLVDERFPGLARIKVLG